MPGGRNPRAVVGVHGERPGRSARI